MELTSVIIPTYKPGAYLDRCLESIAQQTISSTAIEVIIVVNGCNSPYVEQVKGYLQKWPQMRCQLLQTDVPGVSHARNMGLDAAHGEWICFIDDDDWVSDNYLENLVEAGRHGAHLVEANVLDYNEEHHSYQDDYLTAAFSRNKDKTHISLVSGRSFLSSSCCKVIRRSAIGTSRFDCRFRRGEDALFMATISNRIRTIKVATSDTVYYRRLRTGSASRQRLSLWESLCDNGRLAGAYTRLYLSDVLHYNALFFATRLMALARNCMRRPR